MRIPNQQARISERRNSWTIENNTIKGTISSVLANSIMKKIVSLSTPKKRSQVLHRHGNSIPRRHLRACFYSIATIFAIICNNIKDPRDYSQNQVKLISRSTVVKDCESNIFFSTWDLRDRFPPSSISTAYTIRLSMLSPTYPTIWSGNNCA